MTMLGGVMGGLRMGSLVAVLALAPKVAWGQECETDPDCGHGFQCIHDAAGTSSVTGVGGSSMPMCGDGICEGGSEDIESCPADCDTIQYCAPAECSADGDCAEGYVCGPEVGSNTGFTSVGGTGGSICGDGICSFDEDNSSCSEDCRVYRLCQVAMTVCASDDDCPDGFFCDMALDTNSAEGSSGSTDTVTGGNSASFDSSSGSDGTDGESEGSTGAQPIIFVGGVCLPENGDSGTTQGNSSTDAGQAASVNNEAASVTNATGADDTGTDGGETGTGGAGGSNNGALNASSDGSGQATGNGSGGVSSGGASGTSGGSDDEGGCSCTAAGSPGGSSLFGLLAALGLVGFGRRRR